MQSQEQPATLLTQPNEATVNLINIAGGEDSVIITIVHHQGESANVAPRYIVTATVDILGRFNCRVQKMDLDGCDDLEPWVTAHQSSITFEKIPLLGQMVGRFRGASKKQVIWFLKWRKDHLGVYPSDSLPFPADNAIQLPA